MNGKKILKTLVLNSAYYIWIIFTLSLVTFLYDYKVAVAELALAFLLLGFYLKLRSVKKYEISRYVKNLSQFSDYETDGSVADFALPVVMLQLNGEIVWYNGLFDNMIGERNIKNMPITDFVPAFDIDLFRKEDTKISYDLEHNGRYYHIFGNITKAKGLPEGHLIVLYWDDRTSYEKIKQKYYNEKTVSMTIFIDNYEDVMQDTPNADKPKLTAAIESAIEDFGRTNNAIVRKYEKDRYIMCVQKQFVDKMIASNFPILDTVREISVGNKMAPTLSIGVGIEGDTLAKNEAYSLSAIDMALGRGGDQVVIKNEEQCFYHGGKSQEIEKRTRVKARVVALAIRELILNSDPIMIMGHKNADIDVLGAALGLYRSIANCGKDAKIVLESYNETVQRMLDKLGPQYEGVFIKKSTANELATKNTLIFVVDTHKHSLVEDDALLNASKKLVLIDHHRKSADFIDNATITYHEPYASSASELVTEIIQYMDSSPNLTGIEAQALYAGIYMDTKNFTLKTGVRTFEAVSYLRRAGVNTVEIKKLFSLDYNKVIKKMAIVESANMHEGSFMISLCEKNDDDMLTIVAQAADEMLNITGVKAAFVICDMGDYVGISGRSLGDVNVQLILEKIGGGGHMTIAGAQIREKTTEEVYNDLTEAIKEYKNSL